MTTTTSVGQAANDTAASGTRLQLTRIWDQYGMLVIFAILFLLACVLVPNFASLINMRGLGLAVSMSGMVACGMLFCLASGEFDVSALESASVFPKISSSHLKSITSSLDFHYDHSRTC